MSSVNRTIPAPPAPTLAQLGAAPRPAYRKLTRTSGDIAVTALALAPLVADGSFDLNVPAAQGDLVYIGLDAQYDGSTTIVMEHNLRIVDAAGATIRDYAPGGNIASWTVRPIAYFGTSRTLRMQVAAGDAPGGVLRIRLLAKIGSSGTRSILANATTPLQFDVANFGSTS